MSDPRTRYPAQRYLHDVALAAAIRNDPADLVGDHGVGTPEDQQVRALGAHDYVTKPFNTRELLARAKNLVSLTRAAREAADDASIYRFDGWIFDKSRRSLLSPAGEYVPLTRGEFDLLAALVSNAGRVMTRDNLLDYVSHRDWEPNDRTVDVLIGRVRRKIEEDPKRPKRLITVHGIGYVFAGETPRAHGAASRPVSSQADRLGPASSAPRPRNRNRF